MSDYKLSYTAEQINEKLKRIEEGGTGYTDGETIHPIDPKYLPGVYLQIVELETVIAKGSFDTKSGYGSDKFTALSETDAAKLDALVNAGCITFVLAFHFDEGSTVNTWVSSTYQGNTENDAYAYVFYEPTSSENSDLVGIVKQNGSWVAMHRPMHV